MKTQVILAAGGQGSRLNASIPKSLVLLKGKPLLVFSLEVFELCPLIDSVIIVAPEQKLSDVERAVGDFSYTKVNRVVPGGMRRRDSVANGLKALNRETEIVLIHDAARPLISLKLLEQSIIACQKESAVITAVPIKSTIKRVNSENLFVESTLDRRLLWEVQTPQVFQKHLIVNAHREYPDMDVTDDAYLVEMTGQPVRVIPGSYRNIKITTPEDLVVAASLMDQSDTILAEARGADD